MNPAQRPDQPSGVEGVGDGEEGAAGNFETHECRLSFGLAPTPAASDPTVPVGCLSSCTLSGALREARLPPTVVCSPK